MKNKEKFERTYNEIHAPEALVWKVMDMSKEIETKKFKTRNVVKYAVCTLLVMMLTFVASNGICYAATGESLVTKIKVTINGLDSAMDINWKKDGNVYQGEMEIPSDDGSNATITFDAKNPEDFDADIYIETKEAENEDGSVTEKTFEIVDPDEDVTANVFIIEEEE